jgi:protoporphyrinogen oxidase
MVTKVKYLILGAGPSGLSLAARMQQLNETSFLVIEKEEEVGGLCRSKEVDGSPLDIGGGHFLDMRRKRVLEFLFQFMPENEWEQFDRISKIRTSRFEIDYPYEANIWQLPVDDQVEHLISIMNAGSNKGIPMPKDFSRWIVWKLGNLIANNYMLPYNAKMFSGINLSELGTYWLYKLPNVSFEETLRSCLNREPYGKLPAHTQFYYPRRYGYGEVFKRIGNFIDNKILLNYTIQVWDVDTLTVNNDIQAETIISTIPWHELIKNKSIPSKIKGYINQLKYTSIDIAYQSENGDTDAHWTYFPDESLPYHRALYRHNFSKGSRGFWQEINAKRTPGDQSIVNHNRYAYPVNTRRKPDLIKRILDWASSRSIIGLGRWGEWEHMNSDVAIEKALTLAENLVGVQMRQ